MEISIPHIHKIEGDAGFWAKVAKTGKVEELKFETLEGLRQIEGMLVGRRIQEVPIVVSRICGICPVVHILNACCALEKALEIKVSPLIILLRKLFLSSQIIQSHTLHLFFLSLPDFVNVEDDFELMKKFKKESQAALKIRDFSLEITKIIGGRKVHPISPRIGGFHKMPEKNDLKKILKEFPSVLDSFYVLSEIFKNLSYPTLKREINYSSLYSGKEYSFYQENYVKIQDEKITIGDFYSDKIEEDLKIPPVKRATYKGEPYMLGSIARMKNSGEFLSPSAKNLFNEFKKKNSISDEEYFQNIYHNLFSQAVEILHFLEDSQNMVKDILEFDLKEPAPEISARGGSAFSARGGCASGAGGKITRGSGLSAMEAPRGTLFTYFEIDDDGRVLNCNIITPTAQFLTNLEKDLKIILPDILKLSQEEQKRKIRALIRIYDPCISCATH